MDRIFLVDLLKMSSSFGTSLNPCRLQYGILTYVMSSNFLLELDMTVLFYGDAFDEHETI